MKIVVRYKTLPIINDVVVLSKNFAIVDSSIEAVINDNNIIAYEIPFYTVPFVAEAKRVSCIPSPNRIGDLTGNGVIMGVIDSGIASSHREFGDRIINIWDIPNNKIYNRDEIQGGIEHIDAENHGTAVTAIAAGNTGVAPNCDIIFVAIGEGRSDDIMQGIKYIKDRATELNKPFVINISYGTNFGGHNGQTLLEQYIDEVAINNVCSIVVASGNEGNKGHHFRGIGNNTVEFYVGNSIPSVRLELWMSYFDDISISITSPKMSTTSNLSGKSFDYRNILDNTEVTVMYIEPTYYTVDRRIIFELKGQGFVDSGIWSIDIKTDEEYNIWLDTEQSNYFLEPDIYTTLTVPSTAYRAITVGGYNSNTLTVAPFSGRGDTVGLIYSKPDVVAPAVDIRAAANNGVYSNFAGTSFAAPFVSGMCALLLEWGTVRGNDNQMYGEKIKAYIRRYAERLPNISYPNRDWGYGRACFLNIYNNLMSNNSEVVTMAIDEYSKSENCVDLILDKYDKRTETISEIACGVCPLTFGKYNIAYITIEIYQQLLSNSSLGSGIRSATPLLMGHTDTNINIPENIATLTNIPNLYSGVGVLVAIIDDGIDVNDSAFKYENGESRIYSMWVQDDTDTSPDVCFGKEYTRAELSNENLNLGRGRYGTAMAKAIQMVAPDVEFVVVKLKGAKEYYKRALGIDNNDVDVYESSDVMLGIDYAFIISEKANMPLSIVMALGTNEGGHDGQNIFEIYLSAVAISNGISLTTAVGNEALRSRHTSFEISTDVGYYDVEIEVGENTKSFTFFAWNDITDRVEVSIIPPIGNSIGRVSAVRDFVNTYTFVLTETTVRLEYRIPLTRTNTQLTMLTFNNAASGVWRIRFYGNTNMGKIDCWLPIYEFAQSVSFLSPTISTTITTPTAANAILSVGGYNSDTLTTISSSGRGPSRDKRLKPQFVAPTVTSTAISAAFTAGISTLLLEWGIVRENSLNINTINILSYIIQGCVPLDANSIVPNNIWGFGAINLYNIFDKL